MKDEMKYLEPIHNTAEIEKALAKINKLLARGAKLDARKPMKRLQKRWSHVPEYKKFEEKIKKIVSEIV